MTNIKNMPRPKSGLQLFYWLCIGKLKLNPLWKKASFRAKFLLRTLFLNPRTFTWLSHLSRYPRLGDYLTKQTNLPCKLQRPYLTSCMSNQRCFQALVYHYNFLAQKPDALTYKIYSKEALLLAELAGKNESRIRLSIKSSDKYSREGEITIYLFDQDNNLLSTLTFSIIEYQQQPSLFIAGLQGANVDNARQRITQTTKDCYGLFPKRLVTETAILLADTLGLSQIVAVSNQTHIYNNWRYRSRQEHVHSDYDDFWLTLEGVKNNDNLFILPNHIARKTIEDIASKKRSEYRNRYQLLDDLKLQIQQQLTTLLKP